MTKTVFGWSDGGSACEYYRLRVPLDYLQEHSAALAAATREQVTEAAARYLAPSLAVTVVLGDADKVETPLAALTAVERGAA